MASWVRQISIEDDWQEVDDAGSVKSLSTLYSDDSHERSDSDTVDLGRPSVSSSAEDPAHLRTDSSTPTTEQPIEPRPNTEIIAPPAGTLRAADANPEPNVTTDELGDHTSTEHQVSSPTPQEDLEFLQNGLQQLHRLLGEAIHGTELYLNHSTGIPAILMIRDTSKLLREQLFELHPIVQDCAEHWNTHGRDTNPSEIPLNANLLEWTKSLRKCLLRFQSQMDITAPINKENNDVQIPPTPASPAMAFALLGIELEDLHLAMADFLPIIKSDYGEFKTKHMNLSPSEDPRTGRHRRDTVDPTVSALREELYAMRDEVQQILDLLVTIHGVELLSPIAADAQAIIPRLSSLMEAIVLILTNNYSEWLESDLSTRRKILPYPAFRSLSPGVLQDVNEHLKQIREELDVEGGGDFRRTATSQMIYNHQITLLTVGGQMEEIQSTVSFLESLLVPSPSMSTFGERPDTCDALAPQVAVNL